LRFATSGNLRFADAPTASTWSASTRRLWRDAINLVGADTSTVLRLNA
jgi:hypothetical protein